MGTKCCSGIKEGVIGFTGQDWGKNSLALGRHLFWVWKDRWKQVYQAGKSRKTTLDRRMGKYKGREKNDPLSLENQFIVSFFRENLKGHGVLVVQNQAGGGGDRK